MSTKRTSIYRQSILIPGNNRARFSKLGGPIRGLIREEFAKMIKTPGSRRRQLSLAIMPDDDQLEEDAVWSEISNDHNSAAAEASDRKRAAKQLLIWKLLAFVGIGLALLALLLLITRSESNKAGSNKTDAGKADSQFVIVEKPAPTGPAEKEPPKQVIPAPLDPDSKESRLDQYPEALELREDLLLDKAARILQARAPSRLRGNEVKIAGWLELQLDYPVVPARDAEIGKPGSVLLAEDIYRGRILLLLTKRSGGVDQEMVDVWPERDLNSSLLPDR